MYGYGQLFQLLDLRILLLSSFSSFLFNFFLLISSYPSLLTSSYFSRWYRTGLILDSFIHLFGVRIRNLAGSGSDTEPN
jgi:hypothetical protein